MNKFVIVPYEAAYKERIIALILAIQQNEYQIPISRADQPDLENVPGVYQQNKGGFWIALHEDQVIGTIALIDIGQGQGALRKMFVQKEARGKAVGVAQALLDHLHAWAKQQGLREIYLGTTEKFLAAHRFYEKNQFQQIDKVALPSNFPIMAVDTRFYQLAL
ncbi:MAG: GNAT family N-acetyltransferase [Sporomusaceae bacterium]|nr:GNAT family N-acetyltransferase [Sporomusaceae bacterium]